MLNYHRFFKTDHSVKPLLLFIEATLMKKPDLGRYCEAIYGCTGLSLLLALKNLIAVKMKKTNFLPVDQMDY